MEFILRSRRRRCQTTSPPPDTNAAFKILQAYDPAFREKAEVKSTFSWAELVRQTDAYLAAKKAKAAAAAQIAIEGTVERRDAVS